MDLLQSVRKEGSRGGRADFKWEDVRNDQHRENYLGHSLMAPVGRWQVGKDLSWYAKSDQEDGAPSAEDIRKEELRRIKEAEADAINVALGLPVASKNPNMAPIGEKASDSDVKRALAEGAKLEELEGQKGIGFGSYRGRYNGVDAEGDILEGRDDVRPSTRDQFNRGKNRERRRSRSRSRERHRRSRHHDDDTHRRRRSRSGDRERRHRARSNSREERRRRRYRSRSRERSSSREERRHGKHRSRSREHRRYRSRSPRKPRDKDYDERREGREHRPKDRRRSRSPYRDYPSARR